MLSNGTKPAPGPVKTRLGRHPTRPRIRHGSHERLSSRWAQRTAAAVLAVVASERAVWQETHARAEAERRVRAASISPADVDAAAALHPDLSVPLDTRPPAGGAETPDALRRRDGSSVYTVASSRLYTSAAVLDAERAILAATAQRGGRALTDSQVDLALLESLANGIELNLGQAGLVRELACSGALVQLALAPAGTGKTTALRVLSAVWTHSGGTAVGLAPSAAAAAVLRGELHALTDTVAKLLHDLRTDRPSPASDWLVLRRPRRLTCPCWHPSLLHPEEARIRVVPARAAPAAHDPAGHGKDQAAGWP